MSNPLVKYFRQTGIFVSLPSKGAYNKGEIQFAMNGELSVQPMTAADELIATNPESLLNGSALEQVIESCCPGISNSRNLPLSDVDVIMLATKLVSYGDELHLKNKCPKCDKLNENSISIRALLQKTTFLPEVSSVRLNDDLIVYVKPYTLETNTKLSLAQFEETKMLQNMIEDNVAEQERAEFLNKSFLRLSQLNLEIVSESIIKITTPEGDVTDPSYIKEFIDNSARGHIKNIKEAINELSQFGLPKKVPFTCVNAECKNEWDAPIVYDPSSFFASDS